MSAEFVPGKPTRLVDRWRADLVALQSLVITADLTENPCQRYLAAHHALRELAALALTARTGHPRGLGDVRWPLVGARIPELAEWAGYLTVIQPRHDAAQRGELPIGDREADDLVRDAQRFAEDVARLRLPVHGGVRT